MPFHISKTKGKFKVTGLFKGIPDHVYGSHLTERMARKQQKALYANTKHATEYLERDHARV